MKFEIFFKNSEAIFDGIRDLIEKSTPGTGRLNQWFYVFNVDIEKNGSFFESIC